MITTFQTNFTHLKQLPLLERLSTGLSSAADFTTLCSAISVLRAMRSLEVRQALGPPFRSTVESFQQLATSTLQTLTIRWPLEDKVVAILSESKITELRFAANEQGFTGACFSSFIKHNRLRSLTVDSNHRYTVIPSLQQTSELVLHFTSIFASLIRGYMPTFSVQGWNALCALTNLTSLKCTLVAMPCADLANVSNLTSLTSLDLTLHEEFSEMKSDPVWLSGLSSSLTSLKLVCCPIWISPNAVYRTYRSYVQCLPHLSHLTSLNSLTLSLYGEITAAGVQHLSMLPLSSLYIKATQPGETRAALDQYRQLNLCVNVLYTPTSWCS